MDLVPSGSKLKVTEKNKEDYLNELANYKLGMRVTKEIESFRKGLHELVPDDLLMNFDENELEVNAHRNNGIILKKYSQNGIMFAVLDFVVWEKSFQC